MKREASLVATLTVVISGCGIRDRTLPGQPAAMTLAGTAQAPAGILTDASGDWQAFGSLLLLPDANFGGPSFDPATGLPVR